MYVAKIWKEIIMWVAQKKHKVQFAAKPSSKNGSISQHEMGAIGIEASDKIINAWQSEHMSDLWSGSFFSNALVRKYGKGIAKDYWGHLS